MHWYNFQGTKAQISVNGRLREMLKPGSDKERYRYQQHPSVFRLDFLIANAVRFVVH